MHYLIQIRYLKELIVTHILHNRRDFTLKKGLKIQYKVFKICVINECLKKIIFLKIMRKINHSRSFHRP